MEYVFKPISDLSVIRDYVLTFEDEEILKRAAKLLSGTVAILGTATSEAYSDDVDAGAAGKVAAELVTLWEEELKEKM